MKAIGVVLALVITAMTAGGCQSSPTKGMSRDDIVAEYVSALQAGNRERLVELHNPRLDDTSDIDVKIAEAGGVPWSNVRVEWYAEAFPSGPVARITALTPGGRKIDTNIGLSQIDGLWYLALGTRTPHPGDPVPLDTTTSLSPASS
ncbi:hypothetical protein [Winogradskya humida]|uniref:Lipoprotein n=1 Tax=Winogradskya humida TaxID=113566 RepID=A0ABQ3ZQ78_9ACTN|nr:hypothetical protein [Actinoplanes humidus]GIE20726.1 hypothetical protein Ahu01nite_038280 [Actinoplanes humidus]